MASEAAARHFTRVASDYGKLRQQGLNGFLRGREQRAVAALARVQPGARVLDAGCGDGETLAWLVARGARPVGFDLVAPMAAHCHARGFDVCVQDMERPGFRATFDWVLCIGSLEFTREPASALQALSGCLHQGGRFVLLFPRRNWLGRVYAAYHRRHGVPVWLFSRRQMTRLLRRAGLEPVEWRDCLLSSVCLAHKAATPL
jgi:SAM-dependent methyltransferase